MHELLFTTGQRELAVTVNLRDSWPTVTRHRRAHLILYSIHGHTRLQMRSRLKMRFWFNAVRIRFVFLVPARL